MKKLFIAVLSMATLASCFQSEFAVEQAIDFNTYVGSTTKAIDPSINNDNIDEYSFYVWGTTQGDHADDAPIVPIFENVKVDYAGGVWAYGVEHTKYWIAGNKYNFAAVVNGVVNTPLVNGLPQTINYTAGEDKDLLYADAKNIVAKASGNDKVAFTFSHLLSKAVFTFTNTTTPVVAGAPANIYKVTDIKISGLGKSATYDVTAGWGTSTGTYEANFGHIVDANEANEDAAAIGVAEQESGKSNYEHLLIPGTHNVTITCKITLYDNGAVVDEIPYSQTINGLTLQKGTAYNFSLKAGLEQTIQFNVNPVNDWNDPYVGVNTPVQGHDNPAI